MEAVPIIRLEQIDKSFDGNHVIDHLTLDIKKNEFITLLGPSGCGKTTTLRILGGFEQPDSGRVLHNGEDIGNVPPYKRNLNTVFQKYALFPHLNVYDNIAFGLNLKGLSKEIVDNKVLKTMKQVGLTGFGKRRTFQLSGGQQQRVAIARAIVNEPEILLLDEPLGALDLKLRQDMQYELKRLQKELGITFVYVTHDQEEALTMSDTVVVMNNGIIQQMGSPEKIYNEPVNAFVADFIGESNIYEAIVTGPREIELFANKVTYDLEGFDLGEIVDVVIRPEDVELRGVSDDRITGLVTHCIFKGVHYETCVQTEGKEWVVHDTKQYKPGDKVGIDIDPDYIHIMKKSLHVDAVEES